MARVAEIGMLVLMIIQYLKAGIPEKLIPVASLILGVAISFGYLTNTSVSEWTGYIVFVTILNGVIGAVSADTAYSFVSGTKSPSISLPSKAQLNGAVTNAVPPILIKKEGGPT